MADFGVQLLDYFYDVGNILENINESNGYYNLFIVRF